MDVRGESAQGSATQKSPAHARALLPPLTNMDQASKQPRGRGFALARPRYSQTELKTFLKCGKMWEFRYLREIKTPPSAALTLGSSVDTAVTRNLAQKIASGEDLPTEAVLDEFSADFDRRRLETEWGDEEPGTQKDLGAKLVALHHERVAPAIDPATVQERFLLATEEGYELEGVMDLTEKSGVIVDTKTSRTAYAEDALARSLQPALYDFAFERTRGKPAEGFRYDVLVKGGGRKAPTLQRVEGKVGAEDREWLFENVSRVHKAISSGVALPAPEGSWYCSEKWCGYWSRCKGKDRSGSKSRTE